MISTLRILNGIRIVVVSLFSGADFFLFALVKTGMLPVFACERNFYASQLHAANFKHPDGTPVIGFVQISEEEYKMLKSGNKTMETVGIIDGSYYRTKSIQEINGHDIRSAIEARYGTDVVIVLIGGPPCQDYTSMNPNRNIDGNDSRNLLVFEYLRILKELRPDVALMEEVTDFTSKKFSKTFEAFLDEARELPYNIAYQKMNALHYGGRQSRERVVFMFTSRAKNLDPAFPEAETKNLVRAGDFLDIDHFFSGHFTDKIKTKYDFMCTVTSGSPEYFVKDGVKRKPNTQELLLCMDVEEGEYIIPESIPLQQVRKAIGNGVCVSVGYALAMTILVIVLKLKHVGDGYFVPLDHDPDDSDGLAAVPKAIDNTSSDNGEQIMGGPDTSTIVVSPQPDSDESDSGTQTDATGAIATIVPVLPIAEDSRVHLPIMERPKQDGPMSQPTIEQAAPVKSRIINSAELRAMVFDQLGFTGRWEEFMGKPAKRFHCLVHGKSGHGKSTLSIQLAQYLAENFGKVLYVSGEEGFSQTVKNKFLLTGAVSERLDIADIGNYEEFLQVAPRGTYDFIFLDSLNTMKINAKTLRYLKGEFPDCALITIAQATKAGEMRGSYEIVHDSDIVVEVVDGVAETTKNRFRESGMTFNVF